jgi:hypothetical protein
MRGRRCSVPRSRVPLPCVHPRFECEEALELCGVRAAGGCVCRGEGSGGPLVGLEAPWSGGCGWAGGDGAEEHRGQLAAGQGPACGGSKTPSAHPGHPGQRRRSRRGACTRAPGQDSDGGAGVGVGKRRARWTRRETKACKLARPMRGRIEGFR